MHGKVFLWSDVNCNLLWVSMTEGRNFLTTQKILLVVEAVISCHRMLKETRDTTHNASLLFFLIVNNFKIQSSFTVNAQHLHCKYRDAGTVDTDSLCCENHKVFSYHCVRICRALKCSSDIKGVNAIMSTVQWFAFITN